MAGRAAGRGSGRGPCPDDGRGRSARGDRRVGRGASASVSADTPGTPWPIRILHLHSSFSLGGKEARAVRLMNLMGDRAHHKIGRWSCRGIRGCYVEISVVGGSIQKTKNKIYHYDSLPIK